MKKRIFRFKFILILIAGLNEIGYCQNFGPITMDPVNPSITDSITIYLSYSFPYMSCDEYFHYQDVLGNDIQDQSMHCMGMLTAICWFVDTVTIPPLPVGDYSFQKIVSAGYLPNPPCSGGFIMISDTIHFTVIDPNASITENKFGTIPINIYPNPTSHQLMIDYLTEHDQVDIEVYNNMGQLVLKSKSLDGNKIILDIEGLLPGIYWIRSMVDGAIDSIKIIKQ